MNQPVTITFVPEQIITWLVIGLIAGFLASVLVRGRRFSTLTNIILGLVGALIGGFLVAVLRIPPFIPGSLVINYFDVFVAFIGALIILLLASLIWRRRL
jgi:uncharacterized membrane protein YeaQ/YmgE (transglycosylase-associated protein family)